jgi:PEP-CTERM motif
MKKCWLPVLTGLFVLSMNARAQFASAVISYDAGTGFAAGFTNTAAALGAPTSGTSVTPFAPPFSKSQLVSIGAGGQITLQMSSPILNDPTDPYGINFMLFANEFFVNSSSGVNGLFYHAASILVQVSSDDLNWFTLNPSLAPQAGELFPTDGSGNPQIPVNPSLTLNDFTGQNLAGIRSLYAGSAGGTGYDLAWALDANSNSVDVASADYLRIEVQSGVLDLDAISAVPEPTTWALALTGTALLGFSRRQKI